MRQFLAAVAVLTLLLDTTGARAQECQGNVEGLREYLDGMGSDPFFGVFVRPLYFEAALACGAGDGGRSQHFLSRAQAISDALERGQARNRVSKWRTDYGPADLVVLGNTIAGTYKDWGGKFFGTIEGNKAQGIWYQSRTSERICAEEKYGTRNWGRFVFNFSGKSRMKGIWAYCNENPRQWGRWNGKRQSGPMPRPSQLN